MRIVFCESTVLKGDNDWLFGQREKTLSAPMSTSLTGSIMPQAFWSRLPCCIVYILLDFFWKWQEQPDLWHVEGFSCKSISIVWFCNRLLFIWELAHAVSRTKFGTSVNFLFSWLIDTDTHVHVNLSLLFGACVNSHSVTHFNHSPAVDFEIENSWIQSL